MRMNRRAFLGGGIGASLWSWPRGAGAQLAAAAPTPVLAYSGMVPGPLLRIRRGETLKVRLVNKLERPTTLSFPGLRAANAAMGFGGLTGPPVAPGANLDIRFAPPDSGFNIYMPHAGKLSTGQISRGLFGPIIIDEPTPPAFDLETLVVLSDWRLDGQGGIAGLDDMKTARAAGRVGAVLTANAAPAPLHLVAAPGARVRLRLANAATARLMTIAIEGAKTLIIAVDGQPSEAFEPLHNFLPIGPGARFELMFDMPREVGALARFILRGGDAAAAPGETDRPLIVLEAKGEAVAARAALAGLPANPRLPAEIALEASRRFDLTLSGGGDLAFAVNGVSFVDWTPKPAFQVARGTPVTLGLVNKTPYPQAIRLNGHVARLLHSLDDGWDPYWRDILLVQPGKTVHAAFIADNPGKWPIESASPERRDAGLATWFQVM